jgi:hypothetical protein
MTTPVLQAVQFDAPLVNPAAYGLYPAVSWTDEDGPPRWLDGGVEIRPHNYGLDDAFGVWGADWCADPNTITEVKEGTRPTGLDPFDALTVWAADQCDLTAPSQAEVRERAQQALRLRESAAVEREFSSRLLADAGTPGSASTAAEAVAQLGAELAKTNTLGVIHASPSYAVALADAGALTRSGTGALVTPLGHRLVLGGGYVDGLGDTLVATSPVFGWRTPVTLRDAVDAPHNTFVAIAERSLVIGYEASVAAVTVS